MLLRYSSMPFPRGLTGLQTRRLKLRRLTSQSDAAEARTLRTAMANLPEGSSFFNNPLAYEAENYRDYGVAAYYGFSKTNGAAIVIVGVTLDRDRRLRVSFEVHPQYRRQGYGAEAQQAMIGQLEKIYPALSFAADIDLDNKASKRTLLKSGFALKGIRRTRMVLQDVRGLAFTRRNARSPRP